MQRDVDVMVVRAEVAETAATAAHRAADDSGRIGAGAALSRAVRTAFAIAMVLCAARSQEQQGDGLALAAGIARVPAPAALPLRVGPGQDLGTWDMVYAMPEENVLLARRGEALFRVPVTGNSKPIPWCKTGELLQARVAGHVLAAGSLWLVCEAADRTPFAFDPARGKRLDFVVPGVAHKGPPPRIQSLIALPHQGSVLVMLESGSQDNWPRRENRPVYLWAGLVQEKVVAFPAGWDLDWFRSDLGMAVFQEEAPDRFVARPNAGIDLRTGERCDPPSRADEPAVAFDWGNRDPVQVLWAPPGREKVAGVGMSGRAVALQVAMARPRQPRARSWGEYVALSARGLEAGCEDPVLWFGPLRANATVPLVASRVTSCEVLGARCLFTAHGTNGSEHGLVYDGGRVWDVLDGIASLPPLDPKVRETPGVRDSMGVQLFAALGPVGEGRMALCWCHQERADFRHRLPGMPALVASEQWQRLVLVTARGERAVGEVPAGWPTVAEAKESCLFHQGHFVLWRTKVEDGKQAVELTAFGLQVVR